MRLKFLDSPPNVTRLNLNVTQPNPTQSNPTQPNPPQPIPSQPYLTQHINHKHLNTTKHISIVTHQRLLLLLINKVWKNRLNLALLNLPTNLSRASRILPTLHRPSLHVSTKSSCCNLNPRFFLSRLPTVAARLTFWLLTKLTTFWLMVKTQIVQVVEMSCFRFQASEGECAHTHPKSPLTWLS